MGPNVVGNAAGLRSADPRRPRPEIGRKGCGAVVHNSQNQNWVMLPGVWRTARYRRQLQARPTGSRDRHSLFVAAATERPLGYKPATTIDGAESWAICDKATTGAVSRLSANRGGRNA